MALASLPVLLSVLLASISLLLLRINIQSIILSYQEIKNSCKLEASQCRDRFAPISNAGPYAGTMPLSAMGERLCHVGHFTVDTESLQVTYASVHWKEKVLL